MFSLIYIMTYIREMSLPLNSCIYLCRLGQSSVRVVLLAVAVGLYLIPSPIDPEPYMWVSLCLFIVNLFTLQSIQHKSISKEISVLCVFPPMNVFQIWGTPACSGRPSGSEHTSTERSPAVLWSTQRPGVLHGRPERWASLVFWSVCCWEIQSSLISSLHLSRKHLHRDCWWEAVENQQGIAHFHHSDGPEHPWMW